MLRFFSLIVGSFSLILGTEQIYCKCKFNAGWGSSADKEARTYPYFRAGVYVYCRAGKSNAKPIDDLNSYNRNDCCRLSFSVKPECVLYHTLSNWCVAQTLGTLPACWKPEFTSKFIFTPCTKLFNTKNCEFELLCIIYRIALSFYYVNTRIPSFLVHVVAIDFASGSWLL